MELINISENTSLFFFGVLEIFLLAHNDFASFIRKQRKRAFNL